MASGPQACELEDSEPAIWSLHIDRATRAQVPMNGFRFTMLTETGGCNLEVLSKHLKKSPQALAGAVAKEPRDTGAELGSVTPTCYAGDMKPITRAWREEDESLVRSAVERMVLGACEVFDGLVEIASLGQLESNVTWETTVWFAQRGWDRANAAANGLVTR